jgi:hypothetical protein
MALDIDGRRKKDPAFKGAFHEKEKSIAFDVNSTAST